MKIKRFKDFVIFENDNYLAINKPAGIASLHEREMDGSSIIELAQTFNNNLQLCHRIDKETSGVLLLSKNPKAYSNAAVQFEKRRIEKFYHAIVYGFHKFDDFEIDLPLTITRSGRSSVNYNKGKVSKTVVQSLKQFEHYTLVEAKPESGRLHQIRAHLSAQNAPIAADTTYGGKMPYLSMLKRNFNIGKDREEQAMINRVALHARALRLKDLDDAQIEIIADYPKDFDVFLKLLNKYDATSFQTQDS